jgi:DNA-binding MltR family transcriptional regulator
MDMKKHNMKNQEEFLELIDFSKAFDYEHDNDREIVIVGCAYIESLIKALLRESLTQDEKELNLLLDEAQGALPGLVQKARLLYLMGAFPKVIFEDIKLVARVRNHFAHNISASFSDESVIKNVKKMKWHIEAMFMEPPEGASIRDIYQVSVNKLVCHLNMLPRLARYKRIKGD